SDHRADQIKKNNEFFETLFRINNEIMLLIDPDSLKIEDCNNSACLFYGKSQEEMVACKITDFN
ncbi:MAG TPA: hypothetical protein DCY58_08050, partial [Acetobacterium sp.]|nr:hypothetical protein [Acetobacterium sp.]